MASPPNPLRILEQARVSPPAGAVTTTSLPLTFFDISWLYTGPGEILFFYPSAHPAAHFDALKHSLALALLRFHPLAGSVRPSPGSTTSFEIRYNDGDSVPLTLAESDDDFHHLSGDSPRDSARINPLVPRLPRPDDGSVPLLALQVTVFPRSGICLGVAIHHVACDFSGAMQFLNSWAAACRVGGSEDPEPLADPPPFYDRTVIADPGGLYSKILNEMQSFKPDPSVGSSPPTAPPDVVFATFSLGAEHVKRLKQLVEGNSPVRCSTFVVVCAYAWVCLVRAQGRHAGAGGRKIAHFLFSVDCRRRLRPQVRDEYFGNCLRPCFAEVDAGVLGGDGGVAAASEAVGRAIEGLGEGAVLEGAEGWLQKIMSLVPEGPMSVAGSPKFRAYHTDFGWGRPRKVEVVSIEKTPGTISLAESRDEEGGVQIGLALPNHEMLEFESCFTKALLLIDLKKN